MSGLILKRRNCLEISRLAGGETGIRTLGTLARTTVFETAPFNRSGTSPRGAEHIAAQPDPCKPAQVFERTESGLTAPLHWCLCLSFTPGRIGAPGRFSFWRERAGSSRQVKAQRDVRKKGGAMFAVIKTGGKQYRVAEGDEITVEKLAGDTGGDVTFDTVLMLGDGKDVKVGAPTVSGASVVGEIAEQRKGDKIIIRKKRQRSTYRRTKGHRQLETVVKITSILADGKKAPAKKKAAKPEAKEDTPKTEAAPKAESKTEAPKAKAEPKPAAKSEGGDDLTKMKGLGKVMAEKLTGEGITSFAQIAALSADEITTLEEKIGAAGKFEKNEWVAQAAELAKDA